jgi:hypothetical protein
MFLVYFIQQLRSFLSNSYLFTLSFVYFAKNNQKPQQTTLTIDYTAAMSRAAINNNEIILTICQHSPTKVHLNWKY